MSSTETRLHRDPKAAIEDSVTDSTCREENGAERLVRGPDPVDLRARRRRRRKSRGSCLLRCGDARGEGTGFAYSTFNYQGECEKIVAVVTLFLSVVERSG